MGIYVAAVCAIGSTTVLLVAARLVEGKGLNFFLSFLSLSLLPLNLFIANPSPNVSHFAFLPSSLFYMCLLFPPRLSLSLFHNSHIRKSLENTAHKKCMLLVQENQILLSCG